MQSIQHKLILSLYVMCACVQLHTSVWLVHHSHYQCSSSHSNTRHPPSTHTRTHTRTHTNAHTYVHTHVDPNMLIIVDWITEHAHKHDVASEHSRHAPHHQHTSQQLGNNMCVCHQTGWRGSVAPSHTCRHTTTCTTSLSFFGRGVSPCSAVGLCTGRTTCDIHQDVHSRMLQ